MCDTTVIFSTPEDIVAYGEKCVTRERERLIGLLYREAGTGVKSIVRGHFAGLMHAIAILEGEK